MKFTASSLLLSFAFLLKFAAGNSGRCVTGNNEGSDKCVWLGTAPACAGECPSSYPHKLTVGRGGCDNGGYCITGQKALCCVNSFQPKNCEWYGTAPFCDGECPPGKYQISVTDDAGDGSTCVSGCKVFCCDSEDST